MKREIIILTFLSLLTAYIIYDSMKEEPSRMPVLFKEPVKEDAVPFQMTEIKKFELMKNDNIVVVERDKKGKFYIKSPVLCRVDKDALARLFSVFEKMDIKKIIRQEGVELPVFISEYGLDKPSIVYRFFDRKRREKNFIVGNYSKSYDGFFGKWFDRDDILLLSNDVYPYLDLDLKSLRDKDIFQIDRKALEEIRYKGMRFVKKDGQWSMVSPISVKCDSSRMKAFIDGLYKLKAEEFLKRELAVESKFRSGGGDSVQLTATDKKGRRIGQKVVFGKAPAGKDHLVSAFKGKNGYLIKKEFFNAYPAKPVEFVDTRMVPFSGEKIKTVTVGDKESSFTFRRTGAGWVLNGFADIKIDNDKVDALLALLTSPSIEGLYVFTEEKANSYSLLPVQYLVRVNGDITLALGKVVGDEVYFMRDDNKRVIGKADKRITGALSNKISFYADKKMIKTGSENVKRIVLDRGGKEITIELDGDKWYVVKPVRGRIADGAVDGMLRMCANLEAEDIVLNAAADSPRFGFSEPLFSLTVYGDAGEEKLTVGKPHSSNSYFAKADGRTGVFILNKAALAACDRDLIKDIYLVEADSNNDKKIDTWTYFDRGVKTKVEMDISDDGAVDVVTNFIYGNGGKLDKVETDNNNDGKADQVTYFSNGKIAKEVSDSDYDGSVDCWTYYKNDKQHKSEVDVNGDGTPDFVKVFILDGSGNVTGATVDEGMDGTADYRERYKDGKVIKEEIVKGSSSVSGADSLVNNTNN
ncbi:DUF4340 domain-containing protein [Candidatus Auribacterota bacterium]